nr:50S ribosomal protein L10 [Propionibacteriaceae bacterium]
VQIGELADQLQRSQLTIVTDYRGLTVTDLQNLRSTLRPLNAEFRVAKNTLTAIAAEQVGIDVMRPVLEEPTALVFAFEDIVSVSKAVNDFVRTSRILKVRGGVLQNKLLNAADVEAIATLPSKQELQGKLLGLFVSPMSRFVGVLSGPSRSLAYVINARAEQLGGGSEPEAEAAD